MYKVRNDNSKQTSLNKYGVTSYTKLPEKDKNLKILV